MFDALVKTVEALILDFSWKRLAAAIGVALTALVVVSGSEWYTGYFRLARIEKTLALTEPLAALSSNAGVKSDPACHRRHHGTAEAAAGRHLSYVVSAFRRTS